MAGQDTAGEIKAVPAAAWSLCYSESWADGDEEAEADVGGKRATLRGIQQALSSGPCSRTWVYRVRPIKDERQPSLSHWEDGGKPGGDSL